MKQISNWILTICIQPNKMAKDKEGARQSQSSKSCNSFKSSESSNSNVNSTDSSGEEATAVKKPHNPQIDNQVTLDARQSK